MNKNSQYSRGGKGPLEDAIQQMSSCISTKSYKPANALLAEKRRSSSANAQGIKIDQQKLMIENEKCFSVNFDFLDTLTTDDPIVQKLLKSLNINESNIDLKKVVRENQDYFHHLAKKCACFQCSCCNCKCEYSNLAKFTYKSGYRTSYKSSYQFGLTSSSFETPELDCRYYGQRPIKTPYLEMQTQNRQAFTAHPLQQRYRRSYKKNCGSKQFLSSTTYQKMYPDWKDHDPNRKIDAPKHVSTHSGIPILTVTSYNKDFQKNRPQTSNPSASDVKQMQHQQELIPNSQTYAHIMPTHFTTTYGSDFRKHQNTSYCNTKTEPNIEVYVPLKSIPFETNNKKNYSKNHIIAECYGNKMKKMIKLRNQSASMLSAYLQEIYQK